MIYLHSVSAYGDDIIDQIDAPSMAVLRMMSESELPSLHLTWGMAIRNECGLWNPEHPLTTRWHKFPEERDIRNGIDHSSDHPDAVSSAIMRYVHKKVNAK